MAGVINSRWRRACWVLVAALAVGTSLTTKADRADPGFEKMVDGMPGWQAIGALSHQVNISALTGGGTSSGEMVLARIDDAGKVTVLGSIE